MNHATNTDAERAAFEAAMNARRSLPRELDFSMTKSPSGRDEYANSHLESCWVGWQARATQASAEPVKDHIIREVVNSLRDIAIQFHGAQQLRERIAFAIEPLLAPSSAPIDIAITISEQNQAVTGAPSTEPAKCAACDGKGGYVTAEWTDPISGPECAGERCEECEGTGKELPDNVPLFPAPERAPSIDSAVEAKDAARWRFMMRVANHPDGPEAAAMEAFGNELMEEGRPESEQMCELVDEAIAKVAAMQPQGAGEKK